MAAITGWESISAESAQAKGRLKQAPSLHALSEIRHDARLLIGNGNLMSTVMS